MAKMVMVSRQVLALLSKAQASSRAKCFVFDINTAYLKSPLIILVKNDKYCTISVKIVISSLLCIMLNVMSMSSLAD